MNFAVMAEGRISPARPAADFTMEEIGIWMAGLWPGAETAAARAASQEAAA